MIKYTTALFFALALGFGFGFAPTGISQEEKGETPPTSAPPSFSGKTIEQMTADEVLRLVRFSYTLYNRDFAGALRMGVTKKVDFLLSLKPESIRFVFDDPAQIIYVDTKNQKFSLFEGVGGKEMSPVNASKYGEAIRGTDVTYDDLSMRFLYWPDAKIVNWIGTITLSTDQRRDILRRYANDFGDGSISPARVVAQTLAIDGLADLINPTPPSSFPTLGQWIGFVASSEYRGYIHFGVEICVNNSGVITDFKVYRKIGN